jgi:hypothetical protein
MRFLFLTAIGHELSYSLVETERFDGMRQRLTSLSVGFVLAGIYRPNLLGGADGRRPSAARQIANLAADAVLIGLGTRWWHDVLEIIRRQVQAKDQQDDLDAAERMEIERPSLPGISIRS